MIKLRDHYFVAWLAAVKNIKYNINNNNIEVQISSEEYGEYLKEYEKDLKPVLKKVRSIVKELNNK